jgi:transcriptional regulator of acetoin/glycerol metabolism
MVRPVMILVSDNLGQVSQAQEFAAQRGFQFQSYTTSEWQARQGDSTPTLTSGSAVSSVGGQNGGAKILPFPSRSSVDARVQTMNELESLAIENAIHEYNGNLTEAAKALGIGRATLYRKVKQYNIDPANSRKKRAA